MKSFIEEINSPKDLKKLSEENLPVLAGEIRNRIIEVVSKTGGHLASSLGAVELAIAVHYVFNAPQDKIIWDVGHQAYAHKILTGRQKRFDTLRQLGGISGFPLQEESDYDVFTCGHASTSISTALGLACGRNHKNKKHKVVAIIGDASLANGMAFEGLNQAGHLKKDLMIIVNDNELSISRSVGALSRYLNKVMTNPVYNRVRRRMQILVKRIPFFGFKTYKAAKRLEESLKGLLIPGMIFEELGFRYFGPIDGHNVRGLVSTLKNISSLEEPIILHVVTKKGKGYRPAEDSPSFFHGVPAFDAKTGRISENKKDKSFTDVFSEKIVKLAAKDKEIVAITAAMPDGTGLSKFAKNFPDRFYDVGIAEAHAVGFAAGLAKEGLKPVVVIYSTFLQRAYDQIIHDIALQKLPVVFCIDRAGIVGEDGPTHHGAFDIAYLRHIPNIIIMSPKDGFELEAMLEFAVNSKKMVAMRYPRQSASSNVPVSGFKKIELGKSELIRKGKDLAIFALGSMVETALITADTLSSNNIEAEVINARFVKPLDKEMIEDVIRRTDKIVTIEDGVVTGGFGSAVLEFFERENIKNIQVECIGLPDKFITHGKREELLKEYHLVPSEIAETIKREMFKR